MLKDGCVSKGKGGSKGKFFLSTAPIMLGEGVAASNHVKFVRDGKFFVSDTSRMY